MLPSLIQPNNRFKQGELTFLFEAWVCLNGLIVYNMKKFRIKFYPEYKFEHIKSFDQRIRTNIGVEE